MPTEGSGPGDAAPAEPGDPVADAMDELRSERGKVMGEPDDHYWLRVGIRLGLDQPGRARLLLDRLEGGPPDGERPTKIAEPAIEASPAQADGEVPLRSMLLARSVALPPDEPAETVFGWAARLMPDEVTWMGRVVGEMIAGGATRDLGRGFGITWDAGAHLPRDQVDGLFARFTELELTIGGVLSGRDLWAVQRTPKPKGVADLLAALMPRTNPASTEAAAVIDRGGEPALRGLVACWNAWAAMRFRGAIPGGVFEQLVRPWVTVVGRLPEP